MNTKLAKVISISCIFIGILFILSKYAGNIYSQSADLAHHYTLVEKIFRDGTPEKGFQDNLGELAYYPSLAHRIASVLTWLTGSAVYSMNILVLFSLLLIVGVLVYFSLQINVFALFLSFGIYAFSLHLSRGFPLIGMEIYGNYFFSQFVSQSLMLALCVYIYLDKTGIFRRYLISAIGVFVISLFHLLPAIVFAGTTLIFLFIETYKEKKFYVQILYSLSFFLASLAIFFILPSNREMMLLSSNNGWLGFSYITNSVTDINIYGVIFLIIIDIIAILILVRHLTLKMKNMNQNKVILLMASIVISCTSLALLQLILARLGHGSLYAVKKYYFISTTMSLFLVIFFVTDMIFERLRIKETVNKITLKANRAWAGIFLFCAFLIVSQIYKSSDWSVVALQKYQRIAIDYKSEYVNRNNSHNVASLFNIPPIFNYLISIGDLELPRNGTSLAILGNNLEGIKDNPIIISDIYSGDEMNQNLNTNYKIFKFKNISQGMILKTGEKISFTSAEARSMLKSGFSAPEDWGVWTEGGQALLEFKIDSKINRDFIVSLWLNAWLPVARPDFDVIMLINGIKRDTWHIDPNVDLNPVNIQIPALGIANKTIKIEFDFANLKSPKDLKLSSDDRKLSLGFKEIEVNDRK